MTSLVAEDYLNIDKPIEINESVESIEYHEYETRNPASINTTSEITIDINNQYQFFFFHQNPIYWLKDS